MSYSDQPRDQRITLRIPKDLRQELEARAKKDNRTLSDFIFLKLAEQTQDSDAASKVADEKGGYNKPKAD
jgi:uncharacterized protein (DUF1778 family)